MNFKEQVLELEKELLKITAVEASELLLSKYVDKEILCGATQEPGTAMWIVNRSDVYTETLEALCNHSIQEIAHRAKVKIKLRLSGPSKDMLPLNLPESFDEIEEYAVEDYLGHPLVPYDLIEYMSRSNNEDIRSSAALSFTRKLIEIPEKMQNKDASFQNCLKRFEDLVSNDESTLVRLYCAKIPAISSSVIAQALESEKHPKVTSKLLQNPSLNSEQLNAYKAQDETSACVRALDCRLKLREAQTNSELEKLIHKTYLAK